MIEAAAALIAAVLASFCGYLWGYHTGRCSPENPCPKCAFHTNEGRMKRYEEDRKRSDEAARQLGLRHDAAHKGFGWATNDPDQYNCLDEACPRNVEGRGVYGGF